MMKIITIVGARPQFIKAGALSREIKKHPEVKEIIVHTGQHFDENMSEIFFREMEIPVPDYNLDIHGLSHGAMTGQMIEEIERVLLIEKPDTVLVYGDTNSTIAGALAAKKLNIKVAHVEAGLRSNNMKMPEEINRILTDRISDWLFCPTDAAIHNLELEGFKNIPCSIIKSGDVMEDAALYYSKLAGEKSSIIELLKLSKGNFILATIHRAENTDDENNLRNIIGAFNIISETTQIILPLHPRTRKKILEYGINTNFTIIDPVGYFDMIRLLDQCNLVITDSGGLQKEAFFFNKFCITTRDETEWIELIENNYNVISGADQSKILNYTHQFLNLAFPQKLNLYGNGTACNIICKSLLNQ